MQPPDLGQASPELPGREEEVGCPARCSLPATGHAPDRRLYQEGLFGQVAGKLMSQPGVPQVAAVPLLEGAVPGSSRQQWPPPSSDALQGAAVVAEAGGGAIAAPFLKRCCGAGEGSACCTAWDG